MDGQRIIIYGGFGFDGIIDADDSLYVLDLTNFSWDIAKTSGNPPQSGRYWHKANVIAKYMVITFGKYDIFIY